MKNHVTNASQQFVEFFSRVACWSWETLEKLLDIFLDFLTRIIELILAMMNLIFQVICFLMGLCIDAMQTFANIFRGIVNVVSKISCEEIEDFASACIVVLLWICAFKILKNLIKRNAFSLFGSRNVNGNNNNKFERYRLEACPPRRRAGKRVNRRYEKRSRTAPKEEELGD
ncbi:uncharacterized protein LOC117603744 isoform X1 [Osmia lignaria lignaria]|uniref:uncharacterized protein LOC117603744 isoform X1 n=1 Tax=Osmia lignaria lignaria TaxID=1437193 RepID=UPI0014791D49|nr:uncharacterized protein LOC117603744 isoform X1 [Osmia lignaria]